MKKYSFKLLADEPQTYGIVGDYIHVFGAIGDLTIKTDNGDMIVLPQSMGWRTKNIYESITITSPVSQTITFYAGFGQMYDGRTIVIQSVDVAAGKKTSQISGVELVDIGAVALIVGGDLERKGLMLQNTGDSPATIGPTPDREGPITLQPGDIMSISNGCKAGWSACLKSGVYAYITGIEIK